MTDWAHHAELTGSYIYHKQVRKWCRDNLGTGIRLHRSGINFNKKIKWYARLKRTSVGGIMTYRYYTNNSESLTYLLLLWSNANTFKSKD